uniref:hypothetical protein n=1 Tax=Ulva meridionalis TaxID=434723 RepID=UPI0028E09F7F|nr:hypothetical protein NQY40_pgp027 [Ulva meridionalis]WFS80084.1 hypothetical protein [Ulva meridionalis]
MIKKIILANVLNSGEFFSDNGKYIYLPLIKLNYYTTNQKKTKLINNNNFRFIKNLINFLIISSNICFFILIKKNNDSYSLKPTEHYKYTNCLNTSNFNTSNLKLLINKIKIFIKYKFKTNKKYSSFCVMNLQHFADLIDGVDRGYINSIPNGTGLADLNNQAINEHSIYFNNLLNKAFDPLEKDILNNHILKTSRFLESLPFMDDFTGYPVYFEVSKKLKFRLKPHKYNFLALEDRFYLEPRINIKTQLFYTEALTKCYITNKNIKNSGFGFKTGYGVFYRYSMPLFKFNIFNRTIKTNAFINFSTKINYKNIFIKVNNYRSHDNNKLFFNKKIGFKQKVGKYKFKYKIHSDKNRPLTQDAAYMNKFINKYSFISTPKLSNYGFLRVSGATNSNFTVKCSTKFNNYLKGKLLYCASTNQLSLKLKLI